MLMPYCVHGHAAYRHDVDGRDSRKHGHFWGLFWA